MDLGREHVEDASAHGLRSEDGLAALAIGTLLMATQLWMLTVALDLYLAGSARGSWLLALASGLVFLGGLLAVRLVGRVLPPPPR